MVYYIRFLKPPKYRFTRQDVCTIEAVIAITSDLGDDFLPGEARLEASVVPVGARRDASASLVARKHLLWKEGSRAFAFEINVPSEERFWPAALCVSSNDWKDADHLDAFQMPELISAWSEPLNPRKDEPMVKRVQRRFSIGSGFVLNIWEETGESIARHLWDAGLALVAHLRQILEEKMERDAVKSKLSCLLHQETEPLNVIELGSGCGLVGLGLASMKQRCNLLLTDLPEAMEILDLNLKEVLPGRYSKFRKAVLDWDEGLPAFVVNERYDLIVVSDCTYNSDSLPSLVAVLFALISQSPDAIIVVSMKVRHPSEAVFFDLMSDAGMEIIKHDRVLLSRNYAEDFAEIYSFCHARPDLLSGSKQLLHCHDHSNAGQINA